MTAPTNIYSLVDRLIDGGLGPFLVAARSRGESFETIAARLRDEHKVVVTSETVRRWCIRTDVPLPVGAAPSPDAQVEK